MAYGLLNSIAKDLDCMLNDLCQTLPETSNRHEPSRSLPNFRNPYSHNNSSGHHHKRSRTVPRRSSVPQHAVQGLENESDQPKDNTSSNVVVTPVVHQDGRTSHNRPFLPSTLKLPGLPDKGGGGGVQQFEERDKLPGLDGYQNNVVGEPQSPPQQDEILWNSVSGSDVSSEYGPACEVSVMERLVRTHSIWFLRGIYRAGAVHLLQGKDVGNFIIRQSSKPHTMAITVRLPPDKGPYIEHYLIEAIDGKLRLEGSDNYFDAIPRLVSHYCNCCDELPVKLTLPKAIENTNSKQQLSSFAHLGQEFWLSPSAFPPSSPQTPSPKPNKPVMPLPAAIPRPHLSTFSSSPTSPPPKENPFLNQLLSSSTSSLTSPTSKLPNTPPSKETSPGKRNSQRPQPPPRWYTSSPPANGATTVAVNSPPPSSSSSPPTTTNSLKTASNFTVTTTVTFHVNQCTSVLPEQQESPGNSDEVDTSDIGLSSSLLQPSIQSATTSSVTAATTTSTRSGLTHKTNDISPAPSIESPPGYHCSSLADKISDYEDIWVGTPSPGHVPDNSRSLVPFENGSEVDDDPLPLAAEDTESCEELKVIKTLKTLGLTGTSTSSHNWEYSSSAVNQTDQEKVQARNSQLLTGEERSLDSSKEQKKSRTNLGLVIVSTPVVPCLSIPVIQSRDECLHRISNPSPFYSEPIDSLNSAADKKGDNCTQVKRSGGQRFFGHRHSDPDLQRPTGSCSGGKDIDCKIVITTSEPKIFYNRETLGGVFQRPSSSSLLTPNQKLSSSLSDLHSTSKTTDSEASGGFVNVAFRSSSSQLLAARGTTKVCLVSRQQSDTATSLSGVKEGSATLPRIHVRNTIQQAFHRQLGDLAPDSSSSVATTLAKTPGKSVSESLWRVDSSWAWYSRNCSSLPSDSDSSSGDDNFLSTAGDYDDETGLVPVQLRNKDAKFPVLRPSGAYIPSSFLNNSGDSSSVVITVEDLLTQKLPQLKVPEIKPLTASNLLRVSEYDNLDSDDDREKVLKEDSALATGTGGGVVTPVAHFQRRNIRNSDMTSRVSTATNGDLADGQKHRFLRVPRGPSKVRQVPSEAGSSMTEFSEPWDSSWWEKVLLSGTATNNERFQPMNENKSRKPLFSEVVVKNQRRSSVTREILNVKDNNLNNIILDVKRPVESTEDRDEILTVKAEDMSFIDEDMQSVSTVTNDNEAMDASEFANCQKQLQKIPALPCLLSLRRKDRHLGKPIRDYVFKMAQDKSLIFGQHIERFINCTLESHEGNPHVMMRNIRQFMSGMANFLVNSGEGKFSELVQEERAKLKPNEFLNLDTILEGVMHKIVVRPLKKHICDLFVREYTENGAVAMLSDSIKFARTRTPEQLGIKPDLTPPKGHTMEMIKHYFGKLQKAYSPLKKLENLLAVISIIYEQILQDRQGEHQSLGADDFLPMLTYALVHCGLIAAEVEAEYMWGLLHPSLLSGEGGYYLTTLSSAVHVLKHFQRCHADVLSKTFPNGQGNKMALCLSELDGFMKVLIPNEQNGNIISKTVPVRPNMTTKDICKMVAHRLSVTNPQDYALYKLVNGEEMLLGDSTCPWMVKMELVSAGVECAFAYKRMDAKIAWPVNFRRS